jgi:hypothetical protein
MGFEPVSPSDRPAHRDAEAFVDKMQKITEFIHAEMTTAQACHEEQAN